MINENGTGASNQTADVIALVDEKINNDTEFQGELANVSQEEADTKIAEKRAELIKQEYSSIAEKAKKSEELANNYKIRAEKAEKGRKDPEPNEPAQPQMMSAQDTLAIIKADVNLEDVAEVEEFAKFKKISIAEALKSSAVKAILAEREEQRNVAEATNTKNTKRSSSKVSDEQLLENSKSGILPESDEELKRLMRAETEAKRKSLRRN